MGDVMLRAQIRLGISQIRRRATLKSRCHRDIYLEQPLLLFFVVPLLACNQRHGFPELVLSLHVLKLELYRSRL
jgi:hypothetical protein